MGSFGSRPPPQPSSTNSAARTWCIPTSHDDHLAKATAAVQTILRDEDAVTKDHLRRRQRRTGEATYSTSSGANSKRRTGEATYSTPSETNSRRRTGEVTYSTPSGTDKRIVS
ncbi:unnamed protein product [Phytophthora fragariaefolia]|uniref:Unnamed protein product n=1 Tax=Phytophthora fragariaefolia TaxID=1490495 RepID=A0A9W6YNN4_9STRA|nr:unnamed protein product [Phytophthora fragariaefolia]